MERLNRLIGIVLILQSRQLVRAEDIARPFGIRVRTASRALGAHDEAGLPITAEAGQGYSLVDGYHLPPVSFTREEASALSIAEKFIERHTDASLRRHMDSALAKVRAVLPESTQHHIERIKESTSVLAPGPAQLRDVCATITTVQESLGGRRVLRVEYYASYRDAVDVREVEPLGMLYYTNNWHLIAYCRLRNDIRDFRMDRIRAIEITGETFPPRSEFSLQRYLEMRQAMITHEAHDVLLRFTKGAARYAGNRHQYGFVEERPVADGVEMRFLVHSLHHIASWVLSHGAGVAVLRPDRLRDIVVEAARAVADQYELIA